MGKPAASLGWPGCTPPDGALPRRLRQIKAQRLELDREVDVLEPDLLRHPDTGGREVQDRPDAGGDELIGHRLRSFGGNRADRDLYGGRVGVTYGVCR